MDEQRQGLFGQLQRILRNLIGRNAWSSDSDEPDDEGDALVGVPLRPRPHSNSGAVALELPDDAE
jgi:hypothetical protein